MEGRGPPARTPLTPYPDTGTKQALHPLPKLPEASTSLPQLSAPWLGAMSALLTLQPGLTRENPPQICTCLKSQTAFSACTPLSLPTSISFQTRAQHAFQTDVVFRPGRTGTSMGTRKPRRRSLLRSVAGKTQAQPQISKTEYTKRRQLGPYKIPRISYISPLWL